MTVAGRAYAVGECLERAYCLVLEPDHMKGSYVEPYLFPLHDGSGRKLFPWGWGLLYGRCPLESGANLVAERCIDTEASSEDRQENVDARYWLLFRVRRPIRQGEPLLVANPVALPPIFSAAVTRFGDACYVNDWGLPLEDDGEGSNEEVEYLEDTPPEKIELLEESSAPVVVSTSPIHGLGVFAARDIVKGEVVELAPSLPLEGDGKIDAGILDCYTFDHNPRIEMLQLGFAAIYNHSDAPNLSHMKFRANPYLEAWIADEDIEEGQEMFHDYGGPYFDSRGLRKRGDSGRARGFC